MAKFKKKQRVATVNAADTTDLTGMRATLHWIKKRVPVLDGNGDPVLDDDGNPTDTVVDMPVFQFVLLNGEDIEAELDDIAADRSVLTTLGVMMNAALTAHPDYEVA